MCEGYEIPKECKTHGFGTPYCEKCYPHQYRLINSHIYYTDNKISNNNPMTNGYRPNSGKCEKCNNYTFMKEYDNSFFNCDIDY
jgi:hypothetical protein